MPLDVTQTLRSALSRLETERTRLERQITAIRTALGGGGTNARVPSGGRRRRMNAAQRRAVSLRMKAYWAARRKGKGGSKSKEKSSEK